MQYLTADESRAWAIRHGYPVNASSGRLLESEVRAPIRFDIPEDAGARVILARSGKRPARACPRYWCG
jgi:hypothetical protein